jgi:hypothetical protein
MYLASAPPRVIGGQGIAYNVKALLSVAAFEKLKLKI